VRSSYPEKDHAIQGTKQNQVGRKKDVSLRLRGRGNESVKKTRLLKGGPGMVKIFGRNGGKSIKRRETIHGKEFRIPNGRHHLFWEIGTNRGHEHTLEGVKPPTRRQYNNEAKGSKAGASLPAGRS